MLKLGIVGLPNVGKSTLFNALTAARAEAANYPFCTVEPNVGMVEVPDDRLHRLADIVQPKNVVPAVVQFVDIAGLVKGAAEGEGLGNKFLSNIRETDAVVQVVRCFEDPDVIHVMGAVDPVRDREVIEFELALADLSVVEKRLDRTQRAAKTGDKDAKAELDHLTKALAFLSEGKGLWEARLSPSQLAALQPLSLLTTKPVLYAANVTDHELAGDEGPHLRRLREAVAASGEHARSFPSPPRSRRSSPSCRRRARGVPRIVRHPVRRTRSAHSRRLPPARPPDLLHGWRARSACLDDP